MKRKALWILAVVTLTLNFPWVAKADDDKVSGFIVLKGDVYVPHVKNRSAYAFQRLNLYAKYKWMGAGLDVDYIRKLDFMRVRPYATVNIGTLPIYLTLGYQSLTGKNNFGHMQTGFGVKTAWGKWNGFIDSRNYWGVDKKSISFIENWFVLYRDIGKWYVGAETCFTHWWHKIPHDSILTGPVVGYRFNENISASVRFARSWDIKPTGILKEDGVQLRLKYNF